LQLGKAGTAALGILILAAIPLVVKNIYYLHLVNMTIILVILSVGLNLLTGYAGQISIGHAAFYGLGAYASAFITVKLGWSFWLAMPLSGLICAVFGFLIGKPTLRLKGAYLAIASIGVGEIARLVFINWSSVTGGAEGFKSIPAPKIGEFVFDDYGKYYWLLAAVLFVVYVLVNTLIDSEMGRAFRSIREEELAAEQMGVRTARLKVEVFMISTFLAGIAGSLMAHMEGYLSPFSFNFTASVSYLMMVLAGGLGNKWGPIIGVLLLSFAKEGFRFFDKYQLIIYGILLVLVIMFMPKGIAGTVEDALRRRSAARQADHE
jgi:branched-chain amino acid transport system permease protein